MVERNDPIRERYYMPLELADRVGDWLFYVTAALSLVVLINPLRSSAGLFESAQIAFLIGTIAGFVIGIGIRLYFAPRAETKRREEFLSNALGTSLTYERTAGYYNNEETDPERRMGMNVLENTFHSQDTLLIMCKRERVRIGMYTLVWLVLLSVHRVELDWPIVAAQALFSEQLLSRWLRLEWLRIEVERIGHALRQAFQSTPSAQSLRVIVLNETIAYESAKARVSVTLSEKIFFQRNDHMTGEWAKFKASLKP
jgi:hypothetical protein